jgi:hypothetical protein
VASNLLIIPGPGNHGRITVAGVVPLSMISYRPLRRATRTGSSAISEQDKLRTVIWKTSWGELILSENRKLPIEDLGYFVDSFKRVKQTLLSIRVHDSLAVIQY